MVAGGQPSEECEKEDSEGDKAMVDEDGFCEPKGRQRGRARRAAPKARLDPEEKAAPLEVSAEGGEGDLPGPESLMQDDAAQSVAAGTVPGSKEAKKAVKRAAKAAAKQRARVKKQSKK